VNTKRKLLGCSLMAAITLALFPYPSSATRSVLVPVAKAQEQDRPPKPVVTGQVVQDQTPNKELSKYFHKYDLIRMDPAAAAAQVRSGQRLLLKSSVRDFDLQVSPYDMRSSDYSAQVIDSKGIKHALPKGEVITYKGNVKGLPDAQARMSLTGRGLEGAIITKQGRYFLQPARNISKEAAADEFVLYEGSDVTKDGSTCGVTLADEIASQGEVAKAATTDVIEAEASGPVPSLSQMKIARISTDADGEYVASLGGASQANSQIQSILNFVDGIYQSEIGITFQIVQQITRENASTDPYTSTAPSTRLQQFRDEWNTNFPNSGANRRALAHLFTGVDLDGNTIGIASLAVVCRSPNFAYGLSQRFPFNSSTSITAQTVVLTAHEIGHNFSATHTNQVDTQTPPDVENPCEETIMEASVGAGSSFCPFSRSQIAGLANSQSSCLDSTALSPPTSQNCTTVDLGLGHSLSTNLSTTDCRSPSRGVEFFADRYSFNGNAGQRVVISASQGSFSLDPYLYLIGPDGYVLTQDDDSQNDGVLPEPGPGARIPTGSGGGAGSFTLPTTGVYIAEVTSFNRQQTGEYNITISGTGCTLSAGPGSFLFPAVGGTGQISVAVSGNCEQYLVAPDQFTNGSWIQLSESAGSVSRNFNFTVSANNNSAGRRSFIIVGASGPNSNIGGLRIPVTQSGTGPDCSVTPIAFGQTLNGNLSDGDCHSPVRGNGFVADRYTFNATAGQRITILTNAPVGNPDTFLTLLGPNGVVLLTDDDGGGGTNSRIPGGNQSLTLGVTGTYTIEVTPFEASGRGAYSISLPNDVQLSQSSFSIGESQSTVNVNVLRTGSTAGAATVNYATADSFGANCSQATGQASAKCDFNTAGGTLRFAGGEVSKSIPLSIVNDGFVEGNETFTLTLSNPSGMGLGPTTTATITIVDNDSSATNPFDNNAFFVRQQYLDFLFREPDTGGFNDWLNVLNNCQPNQGGLGSDPNCDRVHVSSGFFRSTEFGERGYFAYRFYHASLARRPQFAEFIPDMRRLSGFLTPAEQEAAISAFIADFMHKPEFVSIYAGLTDAAHAAQFIAKLEEKAQVTLPATTTTLPGQPPQYGRQELINKMASGEFTTAQTLRAFIEQKVVFDAFFFRAFVAMQYFGYLLRDPEDAGYNDWVDVLTNGRPPIPPGDFRHLIFGFVWSVEYRQRFGP
jgi:Metallo-peptidase family M12/Calx-beta domain/Bacterial pre-peptidase C-terminal domain